MHKDNKRNVQLEQNLREIIDRYFSSIHYHISRYNPQMYGIDPEDLFQEVKIRLWKILSRGKNRKIYVSYIEKVINSVFIDQIRKVRRNEKAIDVGKQMELMNMRVLPERVNRSDSFSPAINHLLRSRKDILRLFMSDYSVKEIAEITSFSDKKVMNLLYRGIRDLRHILTE